MGKILERAETIGDVPMRPTAVGEQRFCQRYETKFIGAAGPSRLIV